MKTFILFTLFQVTYQFSLSNFEEVPEELLEMEHNDTEVDNLGMESVNFMYDTYTNKILKDADNIINHVIDNENPENVEEESIAKEGEEKKKRNKDDCPMDTEETFQLMMYWEKGTEWQFSTKRQKWYVKFLQSKIYPVRIYF